jgi:hypothetical protein
VAARSFAVATLRTQGPSNKVRGEFLVEFTGATVGSARVWNASNKRWTTRIVDVMDLWQVADWRLAQPGDMIRFGHSYRGPLGY